MLPPTRMQSIRSALAMWLGRLATRAFWSDALERAGSQAAEKLIAVSFFTVGASLTELNWLYIVGVALGSGGLSIVMSIVSVPDPDTGRPMWVAVTWRVVRTFGNSLVTMLAAVEVLNVFEADWLTILSVCATTTLLALLKNAATRPREALPAP
ncbi:holin [Demequina sp. TTPB684]|uniref:holin n=1 Tax=unclassified Demequina TaxID=2620311 RepID=UPI001CF48054|nr:MULTISPECIES: holin [unclassified Demequina]MCB2412464.1 holin [Demequina sp. TTPB684]UPU87702.1 holin [Demequina sp. TMPB413]